MPLEQISENVRIEDGFARKNEVATEDLLKAIHPSYAASGKDAAGRPIRLGEEMTYLDFYGPRVWYVYERENEKARYLPKGVYASREKAAAALGVE